VSAECAAEAPVARRRRSVSKAQALPLAVALISRQSKQGHENVKLAEACLAELLRQEALELSPFKAGDCISVSYLASGIQDPRPYLILEVAAERKRGTYSYRTLAITKQGRTTFHSWTYVFPSPRVHIRLCDVRLSEEGRQEAGYWRDVERTSRQRSFEQGDLEMFEPVSGYMGLVSYRAKHTLV
jgi:hypothetical protein